MKRMLVGLFLIALISAAVAQPVQQSGSVTPGHAAMWSTTGVIRDAGTAAAGNLTSLGITASGPSLCINSGPQSGAYNRLCLGVTQTGGATIAVTNVAGATGGFTLSLNGTAQGLVTVALPTTTNGAACFLNTTGQIGNCSAGSIISGPGSSTLNAVARWANTGGTSLSDSSVIIDNSGNITGPALIGGTTASSSLTLESTSGVGTTDSIIFKTGSQVTRWTISTTGVLTGAAGRTISLGGSSSGSTVIQAAAAASGTLTVPAATDTLVGKATTDTFTNKTFDTAGSGNAFSINSNAITAVTGTGSTAALSVSPAFTTPSLGVATATSINGNTFTTGTGTLTIAAGKTLTASKSITLAGNDSQTLTLNASLTVATNDGTLAFGAASKTLTVNNSIGISGTDGKTLTVSNSGTLGGGDAWALAIAAGKTLTVSNSIAFTGTDGTSFALPGTSDTIVTLTATQSLSSKTLTAPTINGGTATALTSLGIRSTGSGAFDLTFANTENLTAGRTLTFTVNNANRTISLSGNLTLGAAFVVSGSDSITLSSVGGAVSVVLPTSGTLVNTGVTTLSSLTTVGTITSGTWQGTAVAVGFGGTGQSTASGARTSSGLNIDQMSTTGDANVVIAATTRTQATASGTTFSAPRTWTLPAANSISAGQNLVISDIAGAINGANTLTVARAGTDTIQGATSLSMATQFQQVIFVSDGVSKWNLTSGASGAGSGTVTSVSCGNTTISVSGTCITDPGYGLQNCSVAASVGTNILTVALKDTNGSDASATSPCAIFFRSATATTGTVIARYVTAALSINTNAIGATLGSSSNTAFRFWVVAFDNAGTVVLSLYNASTANACNGIAEGIVQSSTAISGSATSAGVFYTPNGTTLSSKAIKILAYVEYNSTGLATAGTYASGPNFTQQFGSGIKSPCETIQIQQATQGTQQSTTSSTYADISGMTVAVTPKSAANKIKFSYYGAFAVPTASNALVVKMVRTATDIGPVNYFTTGVAVYTGAGSSLFLDAPNSASSTTYKLQFKNSDNTNSVIFPCIASCAAAGMGLVLAEEIQG